MSCRNLRKPVLAWKPVGALRFAWLRAPPSHRAKPNSSPSEVLTHKSPYEGGQRRVRAVPTIYHQPRFPVVGTLRFAHPHMGICESSPLTGLGWVWQGGRAARGATQSAARRPACVLGLASEDCCSSLHHLISGWTVGPDPHSACLRRGSHEDETHLRNGCLFGPWVARSSSIPHWPRRRAAARGC